jgi:hypothetical protein
VIVIIAVLMMRVSRADLSGEDPTPPREATSQVTTMVSD